MSEVLAALLCAGGGFVGGLVGVGGGILFVPALVIFLDFTQVEAESTSLLMIVLVAIVGTWRQQRLRQRAACAMPSVIGALSPLGVAVGVVRRQRGPRAGAGAGLRGARPVHGAPARPQGDAARCRGAVRETLRVNRALEIPVAEIELRASRSSGPGGQHANVTASRIEAVFDVDPLGRALGRPARAPARPLRAPRHRGRPGRAQPGAQPGAGPAAPAHQARRRAAGAEEAAPDPAPRVRPSSGGSTRSGFAASASASAAAPTSTPELAAAGRADAVLERALDPGVEGVQPVERERLGRRAAAASAGRRARGGRGRSDSSAARRSPGRSPAAAPTISAPICRWPSSRPSLAQPELGAVGELAGLADVVQERGGHQQVRVEPRVEQADLGDQGRDRDGVLDQAAEVGVVAAAGAGRAPELGSRPGLVNSTRSTTARRPGSWTSRVRCSRKPSSSSRSR